MFFSAGFVKIYLKKICQFSNLVGPGKYKYKICSSWYKNKAQETLCEPHLKHNMIIMTYKSFQRFYIL